MKSIEIKAYWDVVKSYELNNRKTKKHRKNTNRTISFDTIIQEIEKEKNTPINLPRRFGLHASEEDIQIIFKKLLSETRDKQLIKYLFSGINLTLFYPPMP